MKTSVRIQLQRDAKQYLAGLRAAFRVTVDKSSKEEIKKLITRWEQKFESLKEPNP